MDQQGPRGAPYTAREEHTYLYNFAHRVSVSGISISSILFRDGWSIQFLIHCMHGPTEPALDATCTAQQINSIHTLTTHQRL